MADPRDFMLAIGAKLVDADITKISDQIKAALKDVPALQIREVGMAQLKKDMEAGIAVTKSLVEVEKELEKEYNAIEKSVASFTSQLEKSSQAEVKAADAAAKANQASGDAISRAWRTTTANVVAEMTTMMNAIERMNAAEAKASSVRANVNQGGSGFAALNNFTNANSLIPIDHAAETAKINEMLKAQSDSMTKINPNAISEMGGQLQLIDRAAERATATFERYGPALRQGIEAHRQMNLVLPQGIADVKGFADEFTHMIGQFALWSAGAHLIEGGVGMVTKGLTDAIHSEKEQNITGQYYQAQGKDYTPAMSDEVQQAAINMARVYGQEVIHVQENVGLWAKVTKGEMVPALALTNEAMKLAAVSGMNMEEIYRDSVAVMGQMQEPLSRVNDLYNIATGLALRYGGGIQTLGGQSDDAVKQMMDGMTRLSSVMVVGLGHGRDTLARIGAEVAVVSHLTNTSGDEVAGHLAAAFAGIEGNGEVIKGLKGIGIEAKNNADLIQQMGEKMSQVVPIIMGAGVRKQDEEDVLTLLRNYKLVTQATQDAEKAMADAAADKSFNSMMQTTAQQLNQLRAGWEAVGITLGKEAIPLMQQAANIGNNEIIPWLLSNKTEVIDLVKELGGLAFAFGAFSVVKTVIAVAIRAFNEFEIAVSAVAVTQSTASEAMMLDLTGYQRKVLDALSTTQVADEEMIMSVKLFAAEHNISIDAVLMKLIELKNATMTTAGTVVTSEELMGNAALDLSSKTGIAAGLMKTEFEGIAIAGEAMSVRLATAFLKAIPIAGLALTAYEAVSFGVEQLQKHDDDMQRKNPGPRTASTRAEQNQIVQNMQNVQRTGQIPGVMYMPGGRAPQGAIDNYLRGQQQYLVRDSEYIDSINSKPSANPQDQTIKGLLDQIKAVEAQAQAALAKAYVTPPGGTDDYTDATKPPKGAASGGALLGTAIDDIGAKYDSLTSKIKIKITATDANIATDEKTISIYGDYKKVVDDLVASLTRKNALDNAEVSVLAAKRGAIQQEMNSATAHLPKDHGSEAYTSQKDRIDQMQAKINALNQQIADLKSNMQTNNGRMDNVNDALGDAKFKKDLAGVTTNFDDAKSALSGARTPAAAAAASAAFAAAQASDIKWINDKIAALKLEVNADGQVSLHAQDQITALEQERAKMQEVIPELQAYAAQKLKIADATADLRLQLADTKDAGLQTALKSIESLTKEYTADVLVAKAAGKDTSDIDTWKDLSLQIISAKFALDEYDEKKKQVEASPLYIGLSDSIDSIGQSLLKTMENSLDYFKTNLNNIIQESNARIAQLNQEDSRLRGPQYQGIRQDNMLAIRAQQQAEQAAQYKLANPTILQSVQQDIQKSFLTTLTSTFENSAKGGLLSALTGQSDPAKQAQNQFQTSVTLFAAAVARMNTSVGSAGGITPGTASSGYTPLGGFTPGNSSDITGNTTAVTGATTATQAATQATNNAVTATKTQISTMSQLTTVLSAAASGAGAGSGIAGLFGENATGGAIGGGIASAIASAITIGGKSLSAINPLIGVGASLLGGVVGGLFGSHTSPATSPDIYDTATYGAFVGNVNGGGSANGQSFSLDPGIAAQTGGLSEGAYIEQFLQGKTAAQLQSVFGSEAPSIEQLFGQFTQDGGLTNLHNGNLDISGQSVNWQTINQEATDAFNAITQAANSLNQALAPIISISAYGKGSNSATFSPYYTPGYGDTSSLNNLPYPSLFATQPTTATYNAAPSSGTVTINNTTTLDGQVIAQNTSQYRSQQIARGLQADS